MELKMTMDYMLIKVKYTERVAHSFNPAFGMQRQADL